MSSQFSRDVSNEKNPMYGKKHSEETKKKMSDAKKGRKLTEEHKRKLSESLKGRKLSKESIEKSRLNRTGRTWIKGKENPNYGSKRTKAQKEKMSILAKKRIVENGGIIVNFNKNACLWFNLFDIKNNTNGLYATNGGEKQIENTTYFVDYFNDNLKLIMEWDESYHDKIQDKDIKREKRIKEKYPNFSFLRIKEIEIDFASIKAEL